MKITKFKGFGRFGCFVDNFEYDSPEAWQELEKINLEYLVTYVRGNNKEHWNELLYNTHQFGRYRWGVQNRLGKYKDLATALDPSKWDEQDRLAEATSKKWQVNEGLCWWKVTGAKDTEGKHAGLFGDTELAWHSNESGRYQFTPLVVLYGVKGMTDSATGFICFSDWYESQSESMRSELDQLVCIHQWNELADPVGIPETAALYATAFADPDPVGIPLVIQSPGGIKGLHFSTNTIVGFEGMNQKEGHDLIERIKKETFKDEYIYYNWWENNTGDMLFFDNSICLHNRITTENKDMKSVLESRLAYRAIFDYKSKLDYSPFFQEEYNKIKKDIMDEIITEQSIILDLSQRAELIRQLSIDQRKKYLKTFSSADLKAVAKWIKES